MLQRMFQKIAISLVPAGMILFASGMIVQAQDDPIKVGARIASSGFGGVPACSSCHGTMGQGNPVAGFPALAGLDATYLERQILDMKAGTRQLNPAMGPAVDGLDAAQIQAVSAYYASIPAIAGPAVAGGDVARGKELVEQGDWDHGIPACAQCHGPNAAGIGINFPRLAGQSSMYLANQIGAWKRDERKNDVNGLMGTIAKRLSDADIAAVGAYLQSLGEGDGK